MKLTDLHGISISRAKALNQAGIHTVDDLVLFFPRSYIDRRLILPAANLSGTGEKVSVVGKITSVKQAGFGRKKRLEVLLQDHTGIVKGIWFKGIAYHSKQLKPGLHAVFFGAVKRFGRQLTMAHPDVDLLTEEPGLASPPDKPLNDVFTGILPVYPGNQEFRKAWITSGLLHKWITQVLQQQRFCEFLPETVLREYSFADRHQALHQIHNPSTPEEHRLALERFKFEELFLFELSVAILKIEVFEKQPGPVLHSSQPATSRFFKQVLPFSLTAGQTSALSAIKADIRSGKQMNRLLQGDVGSGKTVVAIGAMLMAIDSGYQAVLMAPTEILAEQHARTLKRWLEPLDINVRLLTGQQNRALRTDIMQDIVAGTAHIVTGTHAIIQDNIRFHKLGMAIIDEQHRFGVSQRATLRDKGEHPHLLVMSATPIPRSLAMTLYSDLDISVIRDLPPGRKPIVTRVVKEKDRPRLYEFLAEKINEGGQVYIVYPLIEESEALDLKNATEGYQHIRQLFPEVPAGLLHGRMSPSEKEGVMRTFQRGECRILVSTTVIEVGVDVPNASVMVIEHAERFGLSQLHQLRGRIGRGERQSYCLLMADVKQSREARSRLAAMEQHADGFTIAEIDLKLRGPGDFLGTRQSGLPQFRFADLLNDMTLLQQAKSSAIELVKTNPALTGSELKALRSVFMPYLEERKRFFNLS